MKQLGEIEEAKAEILKNARALIRMKHSRAADREINKKLPELERAMDKAIQSGKPYELDIRSVLED